VPRPRTIDDETVLSVAAALIGRVGPGQVTLQRVAEEVGLSAATLVQRFGSKRELLLAVARSGASRSLERAPGDTALEAITNGLTAQVRSIDSPATLANHLAFLQMDLQDPDFHAVALADARVRQAQVKDLLDEAVAGGELKRGTDTEALSLAIVTSFNGSMVTWAIQGEGPLGDFMRAQLNTLLAA
jgi:AcrR family transcriptional regulator